jgi:hypothetical protein
VSRLRAATAEADFVPSPKGDGGQPGLRQKSVKCVAGRMSAIEAMRSWPCNETTLCAMSLRVSLVTPEQMRQQYACEAIRILVEY